MKKTKQFSLGDKVFAKVKGYPAWPARVDEELGKKFKVYFYGTGETAVVKVEDLYSYLDHKDQFTKSLKRKDYNDAFEEIEAAIAAGESIKSPIKISTKPESQDTKRGVKRKISIENTITDPEPKVKKTSPVKNVAESKKVPQASPANTKTSKEASLIMDITEPEDDSKRNNNKDSGANKSAKKMIKSKKSMETVSQDIEEVEPTESKKTTRKQLVEDKKPLVSIISPQQLQYVITEFEKLETDVEDKDIPSLELPPAIPNGLLLARIEYGQYIGIKINKDRPTHFKNEVERLRWEENDAQTALELKEKVEYATINPEDNPDLFEMNPNLTKEQIQQATGSRIMERKKNKLRWLKIESCLVELDAMIKTSLGLDKADPKKALKHLDTMVELTIDPLMLKKHPHVVDMVKRLRRYIGNVKEWKLKDKELEEFKKQAELIRMKADLVYNKFKALFVISENTSFWEVFQEQISKFKMLTKDMAESQVFALCAEPGSKQAQWDDLDDQEEIKLITGKLGKKKEKENSDDITTHIEGEDDDFVDEAQMAENHG